MNSDDQAVEKLQRLLLPRPGEPTDVRMLYYVATYEGTGRVKNQNRSTIRIPAGGEVSFETYFNAFPASYWRRWSQLDRVVLRLGLRGAARIDVFRSRPTGGRIEIDSRQVEDETAEFSLSLAPFEDGGWYWFEITAETDTTVDSGGWYAPTAPGPQTMPDGTEVGPFDKRVTVGIPTFNRPADAVAALRALAEDPEVDAIIDAVLMPDQGTQHPADEPGYREIVDHFGERFREYRQGNLGGSGGYSRIMYEALGEDTPDSPYILFMDDDIAIEPDSILRAVQIARYCSRPILVGGQMLNLLNRPELRTMGEIVNRADFMWGPAPNVSYDHDFSRYPMSYRAHGEERHKYDSRDIHRRIDVDYNGWWMCLFPAIMAREVGQPLPLFIKWDDTEYSLRAGRLGFPTATWPGVAIWHMSWADKDDAIDWQAYFHLRNRLIVAALQHDGPIGGIVSSLRKSTVKHLLCLEYSTLAIQIEAMKDFLAGPERLFEILETSLPRINAIRKRFSDAQVVPSAAELPAPAGDPGVPRKNALGPLRYLRRLGWLVKSIRHELSPVNPAHHDVPQANLTKDEARWYNLARLDGATVTTADGKGVTFRKRDRELAGSLLAETVRLQREVASRFDELRARYRAAYPNLVSREAWSGIFEAPDAAESAGEGDRR